MMRVEQAGSPSLSLCKHCHSLIPEGSQDLYCCHGCEKAFDLIKSLELNQFYSMVPKDKSVPRMNSPDRISYEAFDASSLQKEIIHPVHDGLQEAHFYLSNMTCFACVWVCEQLTRKVDSSSQLSVNMSTGEASLIFPKDGPALSEFVKNYETLGFAVTPNAQFRKDTRGDISRIGVAFFCLMNVMMLAFPEYLDVASLDKGFRDLFRGISAFLAAITIMYSGWPFLQNAFRSALKAKLHLDFPISLALLTGYIYSFLNMVGGKEHVYFDSMIAVVALLLIGRVLQSRALGRIMREQTRFLEGSRQFVRPQGEKEGLLPLTEARKGQVFTFLPGELIPIRSRLLHDSAEVHYGLLRGETQARCLGKFDEISAGAVNGSHFLEAEALEDGSESILLQLQSASQALYQTKGRFLSLSERMARFFTFFVLAAAISVGLWFLPTDIDEAFRRFSAVLLVACPCVFAFGAPLVFARAFVLGTRRGLVFRSQKALEKLGEVQNFYFDKTGTLTQDESRVSDLHWHDFNLKVLGLKKADILPLLSRLGDVSSHYSSRALAEWARSRLSHPTSARIRSVREVFGQGLSLIWEDKFVLVGRSGFCFPSEGDVNRSAASFISICGLEVLRYSVDEMIRPEAGSCVDELRRSGKNVFVLSGDQNERVARIGEHLKLPQHQLLGQLTPEEKLNSIPLPSKSAMIGNGMNDSLASSGVAIGIALNDASDTMKAASDLCFQRPGLLPLMDAIALSQETRKVLKRCFGLALAFNILALSLAISGIVTPVMAAVLMPASSLSVFAVSQYFVISKRVP